MLVLYLNAKGCDGPEKKKKGVILCLLFVSLILILWFAFARKSVCPGVLVFFCLSLCLISILVFISLSSMSLMLDLILLLCGLVLVMHAVVLFIYLDIQD